MNAKQEKNDYNFMYFSQGGATLQLSWTTKNQSMGTDFVLQVKCTKFWLNIGLRVYSDLYIPDFPKSTSKYFIIS